MDFRDRHVVVTGGTGALGVAVVGALLDAGAYCHVPCMSEAKGQRFAHRAHPRVQMVATGTLADEAAVTRLFDAFLGRSAPDRPDRAAFVDNPLIPFGGLDR